MFKTVLNILWRNGSPFAPHFYFESQFKFLYKNKNFTVVLFIVGSAKPVLSCPQAYFRQPTNNKS
jgi:hypothetical protein